MYVKPLKLLHLAPRSANSGDINLATLSESRISSSFSRDVVWTRRDCRKHHTVSMMKQYNKEYDGIVLGPGGILLLDTTNVKDIAARNKMTDEKVMSISGFQWIIGESAINAIKIPLIVFSIGWNQFRGADPTHFPNKGVLRALVKKSSYFSMRHTGDIRDFCKYLDMPSDDIEFCYCPTIQSRLASEKLRLEPPVTDKKIVGFQIANDRFNLRFGHKKKLIKHYNTIAKTIEIFHARGFQIDLIDQCKDLKFINWMESQNRLIPEYNIVSLRNKKTSIQNQYYKSLYAIFATRGHAQMIPMGFGVKIISIITHDKLKYFLEDISATHTGVEIKDMTVTSLNTAYVEAISFNWKNVVDKVKENQETAIKKIASLF